MGAAIGSCWILVLRTLEVDLACRVLQSIVSWCMLPCTTLQQAIRDFGIELLRPGRRLLSRLQDASLEDESGISFLQLRHSAPMCSLQLFSFVAEA